MELEHYDPDNSQDLQPDDGGGNVGLDPTAGADSEPGTWTSKRTPYQRGMMDAVVESLDLRMTYDSSGWVPFELIMKDAGKYLRVQSWQENVTVSSGAFVDSTSTIPNRSILLTLNVQVLTAVTGAVSFDVRTTSETRKFSGSIRMALDSSNIGIISPTAFILIPPCI